jgi:hypothetical protein
MTQQCASGLPSGLNLTDLGGGICFFAFGTVVGHGDLRLSRRASWRYSQLPASIDQMSIRNLRIASLCRAGSFFSAKTNRFLCPKLKG